MFKEIIAIYIGNHTKHISKMKIYNSTSQQMALKVLMSYSELKEETCNAFRTHYTLYVYFIAIYTEIKWKTIAEFSFRKKSVFVKQNAEKYRLSLELYCG
jgi:hypothetical protein